MPTPAQVTAAIQGVLNNHPQVRPVDLTRLRWTEYVLTEAQDGDAPLSAAILDACFPRSDTNLEYVHYTRFDRFQSIVASGEWRLYWVFKRLHEQEYAPFCTDHSLDGYLAIDPATGHPRFVDMCRDLFYTSLTRLPSVNEAAMWGEFGDHGHGVRLILRVQPVADRCHFRPIRYQNALLQTLLQELQAASRNQLKLEFVPMGLSRIGAFYLPMGFDLEEESRLLIKRFQGLPGAINPWAIQNDGTDDYLSLPLNQDNPFCRIDLVRVEAG